MSGNLDFCGGGRTRAEKSAALATVVGSFVSGRYGLRVRVSKLKARAQASASGVCGSVSRRSLSIRMCPGSGSSWKSPRSVPYRTNEPRSLVRNYDVVPDGHAANVIRVETQEGILADKLVAFPAAFPTHVRWRDGHQGHALAA